MDQYLIEHCSPTLASLKTANLFNYTFQSESELKEHIQNLNASLGNKGISVTILHKTITSALIYVYREKKLCKDLADPEASSILEEAGYTDCSPSAALEHLRMRFRKGDSFPHEIGLFLGYPPGDVTGYIQNHGRNSKCSGCWKVYCDECEAVKTFNRFNKCKSLYKSMFHQGKTICQLTVAV